jgi:hypothetical protein
MPATTVRIKRETREALRELEQQTGCRTPELLHRAVDQFRRSLILAETNVAYSALRADDEGWREELREREAWDTALADGLDDEDDPA